MGRLAMSVGPACIIFAITPLDADPAGRERAVIQDMPPMARALHTQSQRKERFDGVSWKT